MMTICYLNEKHKVMFPEHRSLRLSDDKYTYENFKVPRQLEGKSAVSNSSTSIVVSINIIPDL